MILYIHGFFIFIFIVSSVVQQELSYSIQVNYPLFYLVKVPLAPIAACCSLVERNPRPGMHQLQLLVSHTVILQPWFGSQIAESFLTPSSDLQPLK